MDSMEHSRLEGNAGEQPDAERPTLDGARYDRADIEAQFGDPIDTTGKLELSAKVLPDGNVAVKFPEDATIATELLKVLAQAVANHVAKTLPRVVEAKGLPFHKRNGQPKLLRGMN